MAVKSADIFVGRKVVLYGAILGWCQKRARGSNQYATKYKVTVLFDDGTPEGDEVVDETYLDGYEDGGN